MLFNSIEFALFLPIVFGFYWTLNRKGLNFQNLLIVAASYIFYGWWDWRFLSLIVISTLIDFTVGIELGKSEARWNRKLLLWISILANLGFLGVFKYYNFFLDSLYDTIPGLKVVLGFNTLDIILPVGISFYTFQTLSYSIDVYQKRLQPTRNIIAFSAYVSFFPQLVAGPIERATNLLPQFKKKRKFDYANAVDGLKQILWGLFKKVVIADNCAVYANYIFENSSDLSGSTLFLGAIFFSFQIYGDFSGYSDIAIGTARLFGFNLMQNFAFPYFSRDIAEFWRRWHISLSTWFRDYVYIPLGGSRGGTWMKVRNTFIIFLISGFWHGANWTFIAWGALNAFYFLPLLLSRKNRQNIEVVAKDSYFPSLRELGGIAITFFLTVIAWIFFRAENISHALNYLTGIFSESLLEVPYYKGIGATREIVFVFLIFLFIEWIGRRNRHALEHLPIKWRFSRWVFYSFVIFLIGMYSPTDESPFIYFQF